MTSNGAAVMALMPSGGGHSKAKPFAAMGARIRARRIELGLTIADLAAAMVPPVTRSAVEQWEAGHVSPKPENLDTLAGWLDVTMEYLVAGRSGEGLRTAQTVEEEIALRSLRRLPAEQRQLIISIIAIFSGEPRLRRLPMDRRTAILSAIGDLAGQIDPPALTKARARR